MGLGSRGLGFRVRGLGFRIGGLGFRVPTSIVGGPCHTSQGCEALHAALNLLEESREWRNAVDLPIIKWVAFSFPRPKS